jgi:hypothetical protein
MVANIQIEEDTIKGKLIERNDRLDAIGSINWIALLVP